MSLDDIEDRLDGLVHAETQRHDDGIDLTVDSVSLLTAPAQVDFGGGELTEGDSQELTPTKRSPDDDYGWWTLTGGTYLVTYNESLSGAEPVTVQPRVELAERGCSHPTLRVSDLPRMPLSVPPAGMQLKENARVSTVVLR